MPDGRTKQVVPGVEVGIEVQNGHGPVSRGGGAQQRERDGVVATERDDAGVVVDPGPGSGLDRGHRLRDAKGPHADITGIDDLQRRERIRVVHLVVRIQLAGVLPNVVGAEGHPEDRDVSAPRSRCVGAAQTSRIRRSAASSCRGVAPGRLVRHPSDSALQVRAPKVHVWGTGTLAWIDVWANEDGEVVGHSDVSWGEAFG